MWNSQQISSFSNTQTSPTGPNNSVQSQFNPKSSPQTKCIVIVCFSPERFAFFYTFSVITRMVLIWKLLLIVLIGPFSLEDSFWHALYVCVYVQSATWTSEQPLSFLLLLFSEHYNHTKLQSEHPDWTNYKLNQLRFNLIKSSRCLEGLNGKSPNCTTAHYLGSNQLN